MTAIEPMTQQTKTRTFEKNHYRYTVTWTENPYVDLNFLAEFMDLERLHEYGQTWYVMDCRVMIHLPFPYRYGANAPLIGWADSMGLIYSDSPSQEIAWIEETLIREAEFAVDCLKHALGRLP